MDSFIETAFGRARLLLPQEVRQMQLWGESFQSTVKDHRFYNVVDSTLAGGFAFYYLLLEDGQGRHRWIQPVFLVDQDLVATAPSLIRTWTSHLRTFFPRFLQFKMLMAGCAAGEGHPGGAASDFSWSLAAAGAALPQFARKTGAWMVIWKDWPAAYRDSCAVLTDSGRFHRLPSMPATQLALNYASFEDYLQRQLSYAMRKNLRRKFKVTAKRPLVMSVVHEISEMVDEVHALYEQVLARSSLQFERLTKEFLLELGLQMPDRTRFFLWRDEGRLVACSICMVHDGAIYDEYLGLDYAVALDLHLYFVTLRDILSWAIANGLRTYRSTPLDYDPKLHLGFELAPLDLYVAGVSPLLHWALRSLLPWIEPTRIEPTLQKFPNAAELQVGN